MLGPLQPLHDLLGPTIFFYAVSPAIKIAALLFLGIRERLGNYGVCDRLLDTLSLQLESDPARAEPLACHRPRGQISGELKIRARVDGRGRPPRGTVFVPFFDEHTRINELTLDAYCPISKQPDYKKCAVRVERVALRTQEG